MKSTLIVLSLLLSVASFAKSTLRVPVKLEGESLTAVNAKLAKKGIKEIPAYFEIASDQQTPWKALELFEKGISAKGKKIGKDLYLDTLSHPGLGVCYTGDSVSEVIELVFSLTDSYFSDQMQLIASAYKNVKTISYDSSDEVLSPTSSDEIKEENARLESESNLWKAWRGNGEAILLLVSLGDSGDDVNESLILKCR